MESSLTDEERERYSRHLLLPEIGEAGQLRLKSGSVLVIGAGGLGSPVCLYLAAAGVGRIGVMDGDCLDRTNLQRQVAHDTAAIGRSKALSAAGRMRALNPDVEVEPSSCLFTAGNAAEMLARYDFVVDATDSIAAKFLINDACVAAGRPFSHGAISRFRGHTMTWLPGAPCYRCLFSSMPEADDAPPAGPVGAVAGIIGSIQAAEAIKYLSGAGTLLTGTLLGVDTLTMEFTRLRVPKRCGCEACAAVSVI